MSFSFEWAIGALIATVLGLVIYSAVVEYNFDYEACQTTDQYRQQHAAAYTSYMKVGDVMIPTYHPAREWTQRLYQCPSKKGRFAKWRNEDRP